MEKFKDLILKDDNVQELMHIREEYSKYSEVILVGGAVVDLIDSRKPKDYDLLTSADGFVKGLISEGFKYCHESKTARTYSKGSLTVQILKTDISDFDFKISQSRFLLKEQKIKIDDVSINQRVLIPVRMSNYSCLLRVPHYKKKGFYLPDETYISLVRGLLNKKYNSINS